MQIELSAPPQIFQDRRARFAQSLNRPMLIFAGHAPARTYAGNPHAFRAASNYLYFGGYPLEHAALVIEPGCDGKNGCRLFRPPPGPDDPLWLGENPPDDDMVTAGGLAVANVFDLAALDREISGKNASTITPPFVDTVAHAARLDLSPPTESDLLALIDMRLIKDKHEIEAMRIAARIGSQAHRAAMAACHIGATEWDVQAALMAVLQANGCAASFSPITTVRGEILHGVSAGTRLEDGQLMLVDAGAEIASGYASDITRTFPVSGTWTPMQRALYDTVLRAQRAAINACVPGSRYRDIHMIAAREISAGLVEAELLTGDPDELTERGAYALFFAHGVGHLLGLDVHDMEDFGDLAGYAAGRARPTRFGDKFLRLDRDLSPGMTVTIEPGIYLVPAIWRREDLIGPHRDVVNLPRVNQLLEGQFGGIRIEEDVLVRPTGEEPEILNTGLPSDADAVAALVGAD